MPDSSKENPSGSDSNRYAFLASTSKSGGVTVEFVYDKVVARVTDLMEKAAKAASFKPDNTVSVSSVEVLKKCVSELNSILKGPTKEAVNLSQNDESSSFRP